MYRNKNECKSGSDSKRKTENKDEEKKMDGAKRPSKRKQFCHEEPEKVGEDVILTPEENVHLCESEEVNVCNRLVLFWGLPIIECLNILR